VRTRLDGVAAGIDMVVISMTQSLVLGVLAGVSLDPILDLRFEYWPYILIGLLIVLNFWARTIIHVLSFTTWPPDLFRAFAYFAAAFIEGLAVRQILNPTNFFALGVIYTISAWILYWIDRRFIFRHMRKDETPSGKLLLQDILRDQVWNLRFGVPIFSIISGLSAGLCFFRPEVFFGGRWHLLLACAALVAAGLYLGQTVSLLAKRSRLIFQRDIERRMQSLPVDSREV
jgi:hypothetical protein